MLIPFLLNNLFTSEESTVGASVSGTVATGLSESQVVTGGETIIITLTEDTWVAVGATFDAQRQNIINGITSAQAETTGWNNEVRDNEVVTSVVRTSDTVVTITLSASASYDITNNEVITVTVPNTALVTSTEDLVATPTFGVLSDNQSLVFTRQPFRMLLGHRGRG